MKTLSCNRVIFSGHAISRLFERKISPLQVRNLIAQAEIIRKYPDDIPFPSYLLLVFDERRPLHLVVAKENESDECVLVTIYEPDSELWKKDFKERK